MATPFVETRLEPLWVTTVTRLLFARKGDGPVNVSELRTTVTFESLIRIRGTEEFVVTVPVAMKRAPDNGVEPHVAAFPLITRRDRERLQVAIKCYREPSERWKRFTVHLTDGSKCQKCIQN
jgi:hypothetical protein